MQQAAVGVEPVARHFPVIPRKGWAYDAPMATRYLPNIAHPGFLAAVLDAVPDFSPADSEQFRGEQNKTIVQGGHAVILVDVDLSNYAAVCRMWKVAQNADSFRRYVDWRGPQQVAENQAQPKGA